MDNKQLSALKKHSDLLAQLIFRLSQFYDGFSPQIDSELKVLRGHLAGQPNFTLASISIDKLNNLIHGADTSVRRFKADSLSELQQSVKRLQASLNGQAGANKELNQLVMALNQPLDSINALKTLTSRTLSVLSEQIEGAGKPAVKGNGAAVKEHNPEINQSVYDELNQLVNSYAQKHPTDSQLLQIREKLAMGMSEDELLQSCIVIIRLILKDTISEASLSGKVIQGLHQNLSSISDTVTDSIEQSQQDFDSRIASHDDMQLQLDNFEDSVRESESLENLKQQAQAHVNAMASTLSQRKQEEQEQQSALMVLLNSMQDQLTQLQRQTQVYRKKLAEQILSNQTDPLTRLPNRQAYNERVNRECRRAENTGNALSIAIIDIDFFKSINDKFGHAAGDKTLQVIARHIRNSLDKRDFCARWGGEEFVLLLPETDLSELADRLETIRANLMQLPFKFKQEKITITASFGATVFIPGESPDVMFERADKLLYQAKHNGRNRVEITQD